MSAVHTAIANATRIARFGHRPDPPHMRLQRSSRDILGTTPSIPRTASLAHFAGATFDQGMTGSCVGHGSAQLTTIAFGGSLGFVPSPVTAYQLARVPERADGNVALQDVGAMPANATAMLAKYGVCPMLTKQTPDGRFSDCWGPDDLAGMPNVVPNVNDEPSFLSIEQSGMKLVTGEYRIDELAIDVSTQVCASIAAGYPVGVGCFVDSAFEQWNPALGPLDKVNLGDPAGGGHWTVLDTYDIPASGPTVFTILNSWSDGWGDHGRIRVTENWLRRAVSDLYPWKVQQA